jgi:hypothetical protein
VGFEDYVVDYIVDDIVEDCVGLFQELAILPRAGSQQESKILLYQFRHVVKIIVVVSDYDTGLRKAVAGRHFEIDPEGQDVMQYVDFGEVPMVMYRRKRLK